MRIYIQDYLDEKKSYLLISAIHYHSRRYNKNVLVEVGTRSDGATGAYDLNSKSWWIHDQLCDTGVFCDGTKCTNWQASMILSDVLNEENRWFRSKTWFIATFLFGGGKARKNGMFRAG